LIRRIITQSVFVLMSAAIVIIIFVRRYGNRRVQI
jgi:hypothetical protein